MMGVSISTIKNYINGTAMIEGYRFESLLPIHTYDINGELYDIKSEKHLRVGILMREQKIQKTVARNKANVRGVCQHDMDGHFIRKYESIAEARRGKGAYGTHGLSYHGRW